MTRIFQFRALISLTPALVSVCVGATLPALASPVPAIVAPVQLSLDFKVPNRGAPPATAGGASRGSCLNGAKPLTALLPKQNLGLTVAAHPSFFFYLPPSAAKTADFLLLSDDDTQVLYQTTLNLPDKSGIMQFDLPPAAPALTPGQRYHWYVTLSCDPTMGASGNPSAEGWIERTAQSLTLSQALNQAEPSDRAQVYAQAGLWHETLATLAELRRQRPDDAKVLTDWKSLLKSPVIGLETIANEPLMDSVR